MTAVRGSRTPLALRAEIEAELTAFFTRRHSAAEAYGGAFTQLWTLAAEHVLGGKLVRPTLFVQSYEALCRTAERDAEQPSRATVIRIAVAIELLHYAFLLHDDVIDDDLVRRGRPNLIGSLRAGGTESAPHADADSGRVLHWARTGAILMGDLLLAATHQIFARLDLPADARGALLDLLEHTIVESVAGEQIDVGLSDGIITADLHTVLAMSAHKTAGYTFELPLRAAAIVAGAPAHFARSLAAAGQHLGLAFQLQDDLLSVFGDPAAHGKDPFSDLREGKLTAIISYARMTSAWPSIEGDFGDAGLTEPQGLRIRALLRYCGAEQFVRDLVAEQTAALYEVLAGTGSPHPLPPEVSRVLLTLAAELEERRA